MNNEQILELLKKHDPNFLPIDLHTKPWLKNLFEEVFEAGRIEGFEQGYEQGHESGYDRGYEFGRD